MHIYENVESVFMKQRTWTFCKGISQHVKDRNAPYHPLSFPFLLPFSYETLVSLHIFSLLLLIGGGRGMASESISRAFRQQQTVKMQP